MLLFYNDSVLWLISPLIIISLTFCMGLICIWWVIFSITVIKYSLKKKPPWRESLFWLLAQGCSPLRWKVKAAGGWHGCSHRIHNQKAMVRSGACLTFSFLRPGPSPGNGVTHGGKVFLLPKPNQDNPATRHIQAAHISGKSRSQVTMETNYWTIFP